MPYLLEFSADLTICVTRIYGTSTFTEHVTIWEGMDLDLTENDVHMLYWIIDVTEMVTPYHEMIRIIEHNYCGIAGTISDSRIIPIVVASDSAAKFFRSVMSNREGIYEGSIDVPIFPTMEEALRFLDFIKLCGN